MDDRRLEFRVALLALAALASAGGVLWLVGAFKDAGDARLRVDFTHSGGVPVGAAVKLAGVPVGRVHAIHLLPDRRDARGEPLPVQMELALDAAVLAKLHPGLHVGVATQGPLGEPFVELDPGEPSNVALPSDAELRGDDPPRLDKLLARMDKMAGAVESLLGSAQGPEAKGLLQSASSLAKNADTFLLDNRDTLTATLKDVRAAASDLRELASSSKALIADGKVRGIVDDGAAVAANLRENVPALTATARHVAQSADNLAGGFTPDDGARLKDALAAMERISARADKLVGEIDAGKGTLGGAVKDPQLYDDLKSLVSDLKKHPWKVLWKQ